MNSLSKALKNLAKRHKAFIAIGFFILLVLFSFPKNLPFDFAAKTGGIIFSEEKRRDVSFDADDFASGEEGYVPTASTAATSDQNTSGNTTQRVIKTASLTLEVNSVSQSVEAITNVAVSVGGFVLTSQFSESKEGEKRADVSIKVPVAEFEKAVLRIKESALFVAHESIQGRDVTEEFVDLKAELVNLSAEEEQFRTILNRAVKIEDVLAVTRELSRVRGSIERIEGRMRYLESQTDLSTISVSLREEGEVQIPSSKWRPLNVIKQSAITLVKNLQEFIDNVIRASFWIFSLIPYLLVILAIYYIIRRVRRKK